MAMMMMVAAVAVAVAAAAPATGTRWHQLEGYTHAAYEAEFGKVYATEAERTYRRTLFERNLHSIKQHNKGPFTWKQGVNQFTDRTDAEFEQLLGYDKNLGYARRAPERQGLGLARMIQADSVDWRQQGIVTPVKDQGHCGSCWSFAASETIESHWAKATGKLSTLSQQNILSCVPNVKQCGGTGGCSGGTAELAFSTLTGVGLSSEWTYPYLSYFGVDSACDPSRVVKVANITGLVQLPTNDYNSLITAVTTLGPIAISVEANQWKSYEEGVFDGCNQTNPDIDHAVQLVGYGTDAALGDYWLVRNSWSPMWGELGYIRIRRTSDEADRCGEDIAPLDGFGCPDGPKVIKVCGTCGILSDSAYPLVV